MFSQPDTGTHCVRTHARLRASCWVSSSWWVTSQFFAPQPENAVVVPESAEMSNDTGGGIHFDATPAVFDVDVLNEYLEWKGQQGGS